ncbi:UspA domain-containing protein [Oscillochloris trichoides DG-6]|uniref:UspA domain-containing protein n=1 Tax=Oscillochloris trichoides DG-6 TaxID=765420 RepID=E1IB45_9CHLR|nr:universal stress protein [Oscillochloris trichoides]EFO81530.1 UspA domain-containing protein [Oscillochloris trichoides DG-6]
MFKTILVPLDGSPMSEQALTLAVRLAQSHSADVHLVHVHSPYTTTPITIEGLPVIDEELRSLAATHELTYLRQLAASLPISDHEPIIARLEGPIAFALNRYCYDIGADLVVLTTHGRNGFTQLWIGSVAESLLRSLHIPLLMLRPSPEMPEPTPFRHILVPLDGSALAEQILPHAVTLADQEGAELTLVRVIEGDPNTGPGGVTYRPHENTLTAQRETAQVYLDRLTQDLLARGHPAHCRVVAAEHPARAILATATDVGADLIALATRGRSGLSRAILGSVADKVLRGGNLPVLALRPSEMG